MGDETPVSLRNLIKRTMIRILPASSFSGVNSYIAARDIRSKKRYEPEIAILDRFVKPGDRVLDIGANHGLYAYHLSRLVGPAGEVHCFEPIPQNLSILTRCIESLGLSNVTLHPLACGDQTETRTFHIPQINGIPHYGLAHLSGNEKLTTECRVVRLDDIISAAVTFIKCDAEGAESFIFRGAKNVIQQSRPTVLVEVDVEPAWTARLSYTPQQALAEIFLPLGYKTYRLRGDALVESAGFNDSGNYFVLPHHRANLSGGDLT